MLSSEGGAQYVGNAAIAVRDMATLKAAAWTKTGQLIQLSFHTSRAAGGSGVWEVVESASVTSNGIDIVQSIVNSSISYVIVPNNGEVDIRQLGAIPGNDVTDILNRVYQMPGVGRVILSSYTDGEKYLCSNTILARKSTSGINKPVFDFATSPAGSFSWHSGVSAQLHNVTWEGFEVINSKYVGISGGGNNVTLRNLTVRNSYLQGMGWGGVNVRIQDNTVDTVENEFGIVIGGVSGNVDVSGNFCTNVALDGGIEVAYSSSRVNVHDNIITNCMFGIQAWMQPRGGLTSVRNIKIYNNITQGITSTHIHIKNDQIAAPFAVYDVSIYDNTMYGGGVTGPTGINAQGVVGLKIYGNKYRDFSSTGSLGAIIQSDCAGVDISAESFDNMQQCIRIDADGTVVKNCVARSVVYDFIVCPLSNTFSNLKVTDNTVSMGRDGVRYVSYLSYRFIKNNSFQVPLTSLSQLNGMTVGTGEYFYSTTPSSGGAQGWVSVGAGVIGSSTGGATMRTFGAIGTTAP
jgi:hypothetical protein